MLWAFLATAAVRLAIGLRFRIPFLMASTILFSVATAGVAVHLGWSTPRTIITIFGLLAAQQGSYLLGLFVSSQLLVPRDAKTSDRQKKNDNS